MFAIIPHAPAQTCINFIPLPLLDAYECFMGNDNRLPALHGRKFAYLIPFSVINGSGKLLLAFER